MNVRHLATKDFDKGVEISKAVVYDGVPIVVQFQRENIVPLNKISKKREETLESVEVAKCDLRESPIGCVLFQGDNIVSMGQMFDFEVKQGEPLSDIFPEGTKFSDLFAADALQDYMRDLCVKMFPNINPNTSAADVDPDSFYAPYVPLVVLTGCLPAQSKDSLAYFNPEGVVSVAEFLDGLNAIKYGSNSNISRRKTLDNVSDEEDYFNEGYQGCLSGLSSPFYNLYTRKELMEPITRVELAYLTVVCWQQFIEKYNNLYGNVFYLGVNFDWTVPSEVISRFKDGFDYKVSKISSDDEYDVVSLNIKDYKSDRSMSEYKEDLLNGVSPIPMPMLMSLVELGVVDLFHFEDNRLDPLREVSRGELCYFLAKLAKMFPTMYIKKEI